MLHGTMADPRIRMLTPPVFGRGAQVELMGCPGCTVLGQDEGGCPAPGVENFPVLDQALLPYLGETNWLRLVKTLPAAKAYAAGGFHVCVARGQCGGCQDPSEGFMQKLNLLIGPQAGYCDSPLFSPELMASWAAAASLYLEAYRTAEQSKSVSKTKEALRRANAAALVAYDGEGVTPPRDPYAAPDELPEPPVPPERPTPPPRSRGGLVLAGGLGLVAAVGLVIGASGMARAGTF